MSYVCQTLDAANNCIQWIENPPSVLESLQITQSQAYGLASAVVTIFIIAYCYKLVERSFLK
ncbi:hypothetical protein H0262_11170 [Psychrobacter cryohalolentis]|uniref:hypothetical protein n=1 Tax=Psychrobacter sp. D2 TaxID=2759702 RepID=UPI0015E5C0C2|nr:hypothetical protein [Psychrobacter sp. D2]MBA2058433.1 hypothetical protein [Psychrobacter sp. D2]